jgi:2-iminobutanoate/2-iminopropanoate deaminase
MAKNHLWKGSDDFIAQENLQSPESMKEVRTDNAPKPIGPYSQALVHDELIFISGQIPINPASGTIEGKTIEEQVDQVMKNLSAILAEAGSDLSHVLRCTVFLADLTEFDGYNKVYGTYFKAGPPTRTTVQAAKLPRGAKVEIDAIAVKA